MRIDEMQTEYPDLFMHEGLYKANAFELFVWSKDHDVKSFFDPTTRNFKKSNPYNIDSSTLLAYNPAAERLYVSRGPVVRIMKLNVSRVVVAKLDIGGQILAAPWKSTSRMIKHAPRYVGINGQGGVHIQTPSGVEFMLNNVDDPERTPSIEMLNDSRTVEISRDVARTLRFAIELAR